MTKKHHILILALAMIATVCWYGADVFRAEAAGTFDASPTWIAAGQSSTLRWNFPDQSCRSSQFSTGDLDSGQVSVSPTQTTTYTITCNTRSYSTQVTVTPSGPPPAVTASISANPTSVVQGNSAALTWSSNGTSCVSSGSSSFNTGNAPSGTVSVTPTDTSNTYAVTCTGPSNTSPGQTMTASAFVNISTTPPQMDGACSPNQTSVLINQPVQWNASAWNGTAPYSFKWFGEVVDGLTGSNITVSYPTTGQKTAQITATDSASNGAGTRVQMADNQRCTGTLVAHDAGGDAEDGGTETGAANEARYMAQAIFTGQTNSPEFDQQYASAYASVAANPQNYCVEGLVREDCNPSNYAFGAGSCPYYITASIYSTQGTRNTQSSDFNYVGSGGNTWQTNQYYGAALASTAQGVPNTVSRSCTAAVQVSANAPTASISANPISIVSGQSSTLTYSCTNATSASISGVGTMPSTSGTSSVSPTTDTTYTLTCTGAGGTATSAVTVTVAPALSGSCSVSPTSISAGQSATWTASGSGGSGAYTYSWTGTDGLTGSGSSVAHTYNTTGTHTASVTISSGSQSNTFACSNNLSVGVAPKPDLTASNVTSGAATDGSPVALSATITNAGNAATGAGFTNLFQRATDASGTGATDIGTAANAALATSGTNNTSISYTFPSAGTWYVRACADKSSAADAGVITESNENNNCSASWSAVTVAAAPAADLTAGAVSPSSATAGTAVTFSANASNIGNSTSGSFPVLFQIQNSSAQDVALIDSSYLAALAAGASAPGSVSYTFSSAGTYQVRACANENTSWVAIVSESNYGNNCGGWTSVTVAAQPAGPGSLSCSVSNTNPTLGQSVTYTASGGAAPFTWTASDATSGYGSAATAVRTFTTAGSYGMQVGSFGFTTANCPVVTAGNACTTPTPLISANPTRVRAGGSTTITWSATGVSGTCTLQRNGTVIATSPSPSSCTVGNQSTPDTVNQQNKYCVVCGSASQCTIVNVLPKFNEF